MPNAFSLRRGLGRSSAVAGLLPLLACVTTTGAEDLGSLDWKSGGTLSSGPPPARPVRRLDSPASVPTLAGGVAGGLVVVTHAGVGSPPSVADGAERAARAGLEQLEAGQEALEAAIAGTVVMEDDPRYNAGTGANIRLDGETIQMDAALMTSSGEFAAVGVIERVKNPIRAAQLVLSSPHVFLAGEGATRFAHRGGLADVVPESEEARKKYETRKAALRERFERKGSLEFDWKQYWNFPGKLPADMRAWRKGGDTVGTVARDEEGRFAATLSTGGTSVTLYGRIGDVPVYGAGLFAGDAGAVACTGEGEEIIRQALARKVYEQMASGIGAKEAVHRAVAEFPPEASVGIIAVDRTGWGTAANQEMAFGVAKSEE